MKQLLILSGKGGTGKTTIAGAFIKLSQAKAYADCDVDAPNLHLIMQNLIKVQQSDYYGLPKAHIDPDICMGCDLCRQYCRFEAITTTDEFKYVVNENSCEGCGVCAEICPMMAVKMVDAVAGDLVLYRDDAIFSTAKLRMGNGNSGKLVSEVKRQLIKEASSTVKFSIIDGSPGIGCPVIASLSGVDMVLIVAEPSVSGISDMERIIKTTLKFQTAISVCINKFDTNIKNTEIIEDYCSKNSIHNAGRIPYDFNVVKTINSGRSIIDIDCISGRAVREVYEKVMKEFDL